MKRIPNKAAVSTICFIMKPTEKIRIYDCKNMDDKAEWLAYEGTVDGLLHNIDYTMYADAQAKRITNENGIINITVCTQKETY